MPQLFLIFNHQLTALQETDAKTNLGVRQIIAPSATIHRLWSQIPPELTKLSDYLQPVRDWLTNQSSPGDYVLIQGDFGAVHVMVQTAFQLNLIPIYSTTRREAVEDHLPDGTVRLTHQFKHVTFRKYEK
jgi:hypothetical protein